MSTEEHELTIQVETSESHYEDTYANATITFTSNGKSVELTYDVCDGDLDKIMPAMLKDIKACIDDPDKWIASVIQKGPDNIDKLREYEKELFEAEKDIRNYQRGIEVKSKHRDGYLKKIEELKEKMGQ